MARNGEWKAEWISKKKFFQKETGKKAPSKAYMAGLRKDDGVTKAFGKMDTAYAAMASARDGDSRAKAITVFDRSILEAKQAANGYFGLIEKAAEKEVLDGTRVPAKKTLTPLLKVLEKDIRYCISAAEAELEVARGLTGQNGMPDLAKAGDIRQFTARLPAALKAAAVWIAVTNRKPTVASFNEGIEKATRDITQVLGNIQRRLPAGSRDAQIAAQLLNPLLPWAQRGQKIQDDKAFDQVIRELSGLKSHVAAIAKWGKTLKV